METIQLDITKRYSFANYLTWFDDKRRELYDGVVKLMSPAPTSMHQSLSRDFFYFIYSFLKKNKKKCEMFYAPFDVRLPNNGEKNDDKIFTVVQPDICIVCDKTKIDEKGCLGAPDFIAEIISKSTASRDVKDKYNLYEKHKVKEYWIVYPAENVVNVFLLNKIGKYELEGIYTANDKVKVNIFNGELEIDLKEIFDN